jgi:hypothetical protein
MAAKGSIAGDSFTTQICRGLLDVIDDNRFDWSLINFRSAAFLGLTISDYPPSNEIPKPELGMPRRDMHHRIIN